MNNKEEVDKLREEVKELKEKLNDPNLSEAEKNIIQFEINTKSLKLKLIYTCFLCCRGWKEANS